MPRKPKQTRRAWGEGTIEWRDDGKADLRWFENGKRHKQKGVPGNLAKKHLANIMERVKAGQSGIASFKREFKTVDQYAQHWFSTRTTDNNKDDQERYNLHLRPIVGHLPPTAITPALIREDIVSRKRRTLGGATVKNCIRIMSSMFSDAAEEGLVEYNAFKNLGKKTRGLMKSDYNPKTAPWLKDPKDISRFLALLMEPVCYVFALGVMAGLRPGESRGLDWSHIDWKRKKITVQQQASDREHRLKECKDDDSRVVPLLPELEHLLRQWWDKCGQPTEGLVFLPLQSGKWTKAVEKRQWLEKYLRSFPEGQLPTIRETSERMVALFGSRLAPDDHLAIRKLVKSGERLTVVPPAPAKTKTPKLFLGTGSILKEWHRVRKSLGLPAMRFYDGTRHTFATQWLVCGGTRDEIKDLLGHSSLEVTERYIHMAKTFEGKATRNLYGADADSIRGAIRERDLGLKWKMEGRAEPSPRTDDEEAEEAI